MATGYTADIQNGMTFKDYLLRCARAFISRLRDEPIDAPIPDEFNVEDITYHEEKLVELTKEHDDIRKMTLEDVNKIILKNRQEYEERRIKEQQEKADLRVKYEAMLEQVEAWEPPTENHIELKKFMVRQIQDSIQHDCREFYQEDYPIPSDIEWVKLHLYDIEQEILYHKKKIEEAKQRSKETTEWVRALKESV